MKNILTLLFTILISFNSLVAQYPLMYADAALSTELTGKQYAIAVGFVESSKNKTYRQLKSSTTFSENLKKAEGLKSTFKEIRKLKIANENIKYFGSFEFKKEKNFYYMHVCDYTSKRIKLLKILEFQFITTDLDLEKSAIVPYDKQLFEDNEKYFNENPPPPPPPDPSVF